MSLGRAAMWTGNDVASVSKRVFPEAIKQRNAGLHGITNGRYPVGEHLLGGSWSSLLVASVSCGTRDDPDQCKTNVYTALGGTDMPSNG